MLGQFLEFAVDAQLPDAIESYESLGFQALPVSDALQVPYAVVWDGTIALGLQPLEAAQLAPVFVRPELKTYVRGLRRLGIELEFADLGSDAFHRAGFADPDGRLVVLVEARTHFPARRTGTRVSVCGHFLEWSLPTSDLTVAESFWCALGAQRLTGGDRPHRWIRLTVHGLVIGLHETPKLTAGLTFHSPGLEARVHYLRAKGITAERGALLAAPSQRAATVRTAGLARMYLLDGDESPR
jgi:catechol 2,3-dioxygenase-like lactoylglutathione lyase family enzyme